MRTLTTAFRNAITAAEVMPIFLIEIQLSNSILRYCTANFDVTYDASVWSGGSVFTSPSELVITKDLTVDGITIGVAGASQTMLSLAMTEINQYDTLKYYFGVLDENQSIIGVHTLFDGYIDTVTIEDQGDRSEIFLECESDIANIMEALDWKYNQETQARFDSTDKGLEYAPQMQNWTGIWDGLKNDKRVTNEPSETVSSTSKKKRRNRRKKRKKRLGGN